MSEQRGNRTEKATPRKRQQARERGNVLKSADINTAVIILASAAAIKLFGDGIIHNLHRLFEFYLSGGGRWDAVLTLKTLKPVATSAFAAIAETSLPVVAAATLTAAAVNFLQVGFAVSPKAMGLKFNRLNPLQGIKRMFTIRSLSELIKAMLKLSVIGYLIYMELQKGLSRLSGLMLQDVAGASRTMFDAAFNLIFKLGIALLILALGDYIFQWWQREKDLRMTKQEVKDEAKLLEGDPQIKSRIRHKQRQMGLKRIMQELQKASVVITNPSHYAVALRYDVERDNAPVVVAKGVDFLAQKIKDEAKKHEIEIVEDKPLARALYASCEVGEQIPAEMYQAVAQILAYVYGLKNKKED